MRITRWVHKVVVAGVVLLLLSAAAPAMAGHGRDRPFRMTWSGTYEAFVGGPDWCDVAGGWIPIHIVGDEGTATHMGRVEGEGWHCTNAATGAIADGVLVYVAANGDQLHGTYSGTLVPEHIVEIVFDGGTGRFADAGGTAHEEVWHVPLSDLGGLVGGTATGTIDYDASHPNP